MAAPKIIVLGSLNGLLEPAFKKLATLQAKNNFALAILTGDVFSPSHDDETVTGLLNGTIAVPLPTYFTVGNHPLPPRIVAKVVADEEICENFHFLGKRSTTKTSDGIRIVALGGQLDTNLVAGQSKEQHLPFHSEDDAKALRGANSADIMLTTMWPAPVWTGSNKALDPTQQSSLASSASTGNLCAALKPRYHISASPGAFFYEREPFVHPTERESDNPSVTRFISMAPFGNDAKAKAMYAFTLNKGDASIPVGATPSPFNAKPKKRPQNDDSYSRYDHNDGHRNRRQKRRHRSPPPGPDQCYFCLSNPNLSAHMVCSIGDDAYITVAKGPLPLSTTFAEQGLSFPGQLIIIPLPHAPTIPSMGSVSDAEGEAVKAHKEMTRFRESIQAMIATKSSHKLGVVTWEISRDRNVHLIWQLLPVPADFIRQGIAEAAFRVEAENQKYPKFTTQDLPLEKQAAAGDFFRVWLWADDGEDKIKGKSLVMPLPSDMPYFDLQFGRRVIAKLLGLEDRGHWKDCEQTVEEETKDVEAFREAFKEWDFTLAQDNGDATI
ncbi:CwfJ C-terminus 1-domain-containing protein-like protein [Dactylonectria macrodidyma]|uniref:CwfJ C-terminus 1-domain-containing protein-like protein n=1 Tax=Dactylonectria macrodidyma TaxID=307937 RepID=A0A9P9FRH1_9HYPO|nr:CwfJ C-terminus 1-domain-containing protein-like protein [Dactylonectria macrodidyma]